VPRRNSSTASARRPTVTSGSRRLLEDRYCLMASPSRTMHRATLVPCIRSRIHGKVRSSSGTRRSCGRDVGQSVPGANPMNAIRHPTAARRFPAQPRLLRSQTLTPPTRSRTPSGDDAVKRSGSAARIHRSGIAFDSTCSAPDHYHFEGLRARTQGRGKAAGVKDRLPPKSVEVSQAGLRPNWPTSPPSHTEFIGRRSPPLVTPLRMRSQQKAQRSIRRRSEARDLVDLRSRPPTRDCGGPDPIGRVSGPIILLLLLGPMAHPDIFLGASDRVDPARS